MLRVTVGNNMNKQSLIVSQNETIFSLFEKIGQTIGPRDIVQIDGYVIPNASFGNTLEEIGCDNGARITSVVKTDNA